MIEHCNYNSWPLPLEPYSSLLFHVKHFLQKKHFFARQSCRIFGKNPEILFGSTSKGLRKTGNETVIPTT
jgi:hypothetical protein